MIKIFKSKDAWHLYVDHISIYPFLYDDIKLLLEDLSFILEDMNND